MPTQARYEVLIPQTGQDVAQAALQYLGTHFFPDDYDARGDEHAIGHIERNRQVLKDGQTMPHDVVVIQAAESPYTDSFIKQLASYVVDVTNVSPITVSKSGKGGIQVWPIRV